MVRVFTNHGLLLKQLPLSNGVVQLCVGVADLLLHHEELKALGQTLLGTVPGARAEHKAVDTHFVDHKNTISYSLQEHDSLMT